MTKPAIGEDTYQFVIGKSIRKARKSMTKRRRGQAYQNLRYRYVISDVRDSSLTISRICSPSLETVQMPNGVDLSVATPRRLLALGKQAYLDQRHQHGSRLLSHCGSSSGLRISLTCGTEWSKATSRRSTSTSRASFGPRERSDGTCCSLRSSFTIVPPSLGAAEEHIVQDRDTAKHRAASRRKTKMGRRAV